jgi:Zn-dependent protease with chaperone function
VVDGLDTGGVGNMHKDAATRGQARPAGPTRLAGWVPVLALSAALSLPLRAGADTAAQAPATSPAPGIAEVLQLSQQQRLALRPAAVADSAAAERVRDSLARLLAMRPQDGPAELVLVGGDLYAEALFGRRALAVSESVGQLPEGERLLLLAHELGHLSLQHWGSLSALYRSHIPGAVRPDTTEPVAAALGAQAHALSHRQEFEADAFGFTLVRQLGFGVDTAFGLLTRHGVQMDGATHPGTRRRIAQLRVLDSQLSHPGLGDTAAELVGVAPAGRP